MNQTTVYLKCDRNIEVENRDVFLKDVASIGCADKTVTARLRALKVYHFQKEKARRCIISALELIRLMEQECPGISVDVIGETDVLIEWIQINRHKGWRQWLKAIVVCCISFFGTAFTIMAYHNDIGINDIFTEAFRMIMGKEPEGLNLLELSYSIGMAVGIAVFFNHIGGRRFTKDPTPIEVSIRKYEEDVDKALIAQAGREGKEID